MPLITLPNIKKINPNQILNVVLLLVAVIISLNIYKNQNKRIARILHLHQEQSEKNELLLHIGDIDRTVEMYQQSLEPKDHREVINTITDIARAADVQIIALKPREALRRAKSEIYEKIFFDVIIQSESYHGIGKFISRLESNQIVFIVESLTIDRIGDSKKSKKDELDFGTEALEAKFTISELYFKDT